MRFLAAAAVAMALGATAFMFLRPQSPEMIVRPNAAEARVQYVAGAVFVNVRTDEEWEAGHLQTAMHLPVKEVASRAATMLPDKDAHLITYCASGIRAEKAAVTLRALGYAHAVAMTGGFEDLKAAHYPLSR